MSHSVCLQAGHQNIQSNCSPDMRSGTGASGEITWTPMLRAKVGTHLRSHGFDVHQADANLNCQPVKRYDLTLALHYQSYNPAAPVSGFGVFVPDIDLDQDHAQSVVLANIIRKTYAKRTGLPDYSDPFLKGAGPSWSNINTRRYYLWWNQTGPLALIECGVGAPGAPDHDLLWKHLDTVAAAIAEGICVAFGVVWLAAPPPAPAPIPPPPSPEPPPAPQPPAPIETPPPAPASAVAVPSRSLQDFLVALARWIKDWFSG